MSEAGNSSRDEGAASAASGVSSILSAPKAGISTPSGGKWVRFDADSSTSTDINDPAHVSVSLDTETGQTGSAIMRGADSPGGGGGESLPGPATPPGGGGTGALSNGQRITSIPPENDFLPWIVPARFDAYKCPKSLVSDRLSMPVEDYVTAMEMLTNDFRFRSYTACYRRLIGVWLVFMFLLLCVILGAQVAKGLVLFAVVLVWMFLVALGVLGVMLAKKGMYKSLHRCVAGVNGLLMRHRLLVGMEDRGKLSCHKILVHFIYFDTEPCIERLRQVLVQQEQMRSARSNGAPQTPVSSVSRQMGGGDETARSLAKALLLKYSQSYVKSLVRKRLRFPARPSEGVSEFAPLHCQTALCPCQYIQRYHFERKGQKNCCERFFLVGDQNIADLEAPVYGASSYPLPALAYAHM